MTMLWKTLIGWGGNNTTMLIQGVVHGWRGQVKAKSDSDRAEHLVMKALALWDNSDDTASARILFHAWSHSASLIKAEAASSSDRAKHRCHLLKTVMMWGEANVTLFMQSIVHAWLEKFKEKKEKDARMTILLKTLIGWGDNNTTMLMQGVVHGWRDQIKAKREKDYRDTTEHLVMKALALWDNSDDTASARILFHAWSLSATLLKAEAA